MREILFKAKRLDNVEWVYGYYVKLNSKHYIIPDYASAWYGIEVDPSTVCQYTGLTDKNGVEVFEEDVINVRTSGYAFDLVSVKWGQKDASWCFLCENGNRFRMLDSFVYEVIGNIHDKEVEDANRKI